MSFKSAVITFPGSNCDRDALCYLKDLTNGEVHNIWHEETSLPKVDLVILPGGFSFGDYLRSGAMASKSKIIDEVVKHANDGKSILKTLKQDMTTDERVELLQNAMMKMFDAVIENRKQIGNLVGIATASALISERSTKQLTKLIRTSLRGK